jgi:hypothetical protein
MRTFRYLFACAAVVLLAGACQQETLSPTPVPSQSDAQRSPQGSQPWKEASGRSVAVSSTDIPAYSLTDLIADLRALGFTVVTTERPVDHGFDIEGARVLVEDAPVYVYEFAEATAAQTAAAGVSTDEYSMTITRTEGEVTYVRHGDWLETLHVYLKDRVIVVTGDDPRVVDALNALWGPSLAVRSPG